MMKLRALAVSLAVGGSLIGGVVVPLVVAAPAQAGCTPFSCS